MSHGTKERACHGRSPGSAQCQELYSESLGVLTAKQATVTDSRIIVAIMEVIRVVIVRSREL